MSTYKNNPAILSNLLNGVLVLALVAGVAFLPAPVKAASTITVTTNADDTTSNSLCSLREAITNANDDLLTHPDCLVAGNGNDTIVFANGITTITLGSTLPTIINTGTLTINGGGDVVISGNDSSRVMIVDPGMTLTLKNLTISNGKCEFCSGGGVYSSGGSLVVTNSHFINNQQGISIFDGTITITNSTFSGNYSAYGGAVNSSGSNGSLTVTNSTFSGNYDSSSGGGGSAIFSGGTTIITGSTFANNSGPGNGAGAVFIDGPHGATITNSTFTGNSGATGSGLYNNSSTVTIANSTFSGNSSPNYGGGIQNISGTMTITNSTLSGNSAGIDGGNLYQYGSSAVLYVHNTIIANNGGGGDCVVAGTVSGNNNLVEDASTACGLVNGVDGNITGVDPKLSTLVGTPAYFPLLAGSPAREKGDDTKCAAAPVNNGSQNGIPRPQGAHCEIGSVESPATLTFKSLGNYDGWVIEFSEFSSVGGVMNSTATTFNLGDADLDKQYRAILHFNTSKIPDNAIITRVLLKIRKQGLTGTDPFTILGGLRVDMSKPFFGNAIDLALSDFQVAAGKTGVSAFRTTPVNNWYTAIINVVGRGYLNKTGTTQFRLYFAKDDNDDLGADYMKFFSGNYGTATARPTLVVEYYLP